MQAVLAWIMSSRWRAVLSVWMMGAVQWLGLLGGGLVALVGLRQGPREGLGVALLAAAGLIPVSLMVGASAWQISAAALSLWLPVLVMTWALHRSGSLARACQLAAIFAIGLVLMLHTAEDEVIRLGRAIIDQWLMPLFEERPQGPPSDQELDQMALRLPGMLATAFSLALILSLFLGRWWQAILYNPGGFRAEFHEFRHGQVAILLGGALFILSAVTNLAVLDNLALVAIMVMMLQGLAVCHAMVHRRGLSGFWLLPVYGLLLLFSVAAMSVLAALAILDNVIDFRARYAPAKQPPNGSDD
ncbi:hypothetical protein J2T60_000281 [Natronospira proteinivora]|uniref:DUF2232 domain-containing protein n=1 Tax=Natronospira proteinivora TaxID=1807133 RepID=A0ABT1G4V7_9GAMM|nr:hypothetical protein [Natronospira proteinivora]MCP1726316.1 hypothetical protein [Natronospira proteinivora]